jgi:hypothetical protein
MTKRTGAFLSVSLAVLFAGSTARAQDPPLDPALTVPTEATPELTPITLATGRTDIRIPFVINMSAGTAGEPINVPLDIYHGLTDDITLGLSHSRGVVQPTTPYPARAGLCLTGTGGGCRKFYDNISLDAIFRFMGGVIQLAGHGGLDFLSFDPAMLSLRLGVLFQAPLGSHVVIMTDPRLWIGLTKRDAPTFNKEHLDLPLAVQYWITEGARVAVRTVMYGPLDGFSDAWGGALGLFAAFAVSPLIEPFLAFDFLNLYGKGGSADFRSLLIGTNIRL